MFRRTVATTTSRKTATVTQRVIGAAIAAVCVSLAVLPFVSSATATITGSWMALLVFLAAGIVLSRKDVTTMRLPDTITLPLAAALLGILTVTAFAAGDPARLLVTLSVAVVLVVLGFITGVLGGLGMGDVKLLASIGLLTGWYGWVPALGALFLACVIALPWAVIALIRRGQDASRPRGIPFGPALVAGAFLAAAGTLLAGSL